MALLSENHTKCINTLGGKCWYFVALEQTALLVITVIRRANELHRQTYYFPEYIHNQKNYNFYDVFFFFHLFVHLYVMDLVNARWNILKYYSEYIKVLFSL